MTLTLPAFFPKWLVEALAGYWPDCDEDALRREGDHWAAGGDGCRKLATRHDTASATEKTALKGFSADTKANRNVQLGDDLRNQAEYCDAMAEQCYQKANDCEFAKLQVIGTGIALLTQLTVDAMLSAPGAVKAAEDRAAAEASWAASARRYFGRVKKVGLDCATKRGGLPLAKATAIGAGLGAGTAAAVNAGAQFYQKEVLHHRDEMDWGMVGDAAIIGGFGGGIGARFASRVAPRINKFLGKVAGKSQSNLVRYGAHVTAGVLIGGVGGVAGAVAGAGAGILVTGHIPDAKEMRTAVLQGFVGGFVGSATIFARPLPPRVVRTNNRTSTSTNSTSSTPPSAGSPHPGTTPPGTTPPATPPGTTPPATPPGAPPPATPPGATPPTPPGITPPPHTPAPPAPTPPATPGTPGTPGTPRSTIGPEAPPRVTPPPHVAPPPGTAPPQPGTSGPHSGGTDPGSGGPTSGKPAKPSTGDPATPERRPTDEPETPARPPREPDPHDPNRPRQQPEEETSPPDHTQGKTDPPEPAGAVPSRERYEMYKPDELPDYLKRSPGEYSDPPEPYSQDPPVPSEETQVKPQRPNGEEETPPGPPLHPEVPAPKGDQQVWPPHAPEHEPTPPPEHTPGARDPGDPQNTLPPHAEESAPPTEEQRAGQQRPPSEGEPPPPGHQGDPADPHRSAPPHTAQPSAEPRQTTNDPDAPIATRNSDDSSAPGDDKAVSQEDPVQARSENEGDTSEPELAPPPQTLDPQMGELIGAPVATDVGAKGGPEPRPSEWPYTNPPNMRTVPPGTPLDLGSLDPNLNYLWVVDAEGNFKFAPELQNSADFMKPLPPDRAFYLKHGDLQPGAGGTARGPARAGGDLYNVRNADGTPSDVWCLNNNSSYTFRRVDESGQPLPWSPAESLEAVRQHLINGGAPEEMLATNDILATKRRKRGVP